MTRIVYVITDHRGIDDGTIYETATESERDDAFREWRHTDPSLRIFRCVVVDDVSRDAHEVTAGMTP